MLLILTVNESYRAEIIVIWWPWRTVMSCAAYFKHMVCIVFLNNPRGNIVVALVPGTSRGVFHFPNTDFSLRPHPNPLPLYVSEHKHAQRNQMAGSSY